MKQCSNCGETYCPKDKRSRFCTRSCAAIHNNTVSPKRTTVVRHCSKCNEVFKPENHTVSHRRICPDCTQDVSRYKECPTQDQLDKRTLHTREQRRHHYEKVRGILFGYMADKGYTCCSMCSSQTDLQFDHIDPKLKSFEVLSKWRAKPLSELLLELDKCQLLCQRCHLAKTRKDYASGSIASNKGQITHGSMFGWQKAKCSCLLCTTAKRSWYDSRNAKRRSHHQNLPQ